MGLLRVLLALSVVFAHSPWLDGAVFVGGRNAVQIFYIISGFLMSHILVSENKYPSVMRFYLSRWLRIYPLYYVVAFLALARGLLMHHSPLAALYLHIPWSADILLALSNLFLFGQDWVMFSAIKAGHLVFSTNFQQSDFLLYTGLLIPQAWSLGIELTFYVLAPFVLRRPKVIWGLLAASLIVRGILFAAGLGAQDPWTYRFFPAELAFFLVGALCNRILLPKYESFIASRPASRIPQITTYVVAGFTMLFFLIPISELLKGIILFVAIIALLPLLFIYQSRSPLDRSIGELSYAIYIGHLLVMAVCAPLIRKFITSDPMAISWINIATSLIFAFILNKYIGRKIESFRHSFRSGSQILPQSIAMRD